VSKQVLITGATGFVGRQVLKHLVDSGVHVRAIVRSEGTSWIKSEFPSVKVISTNDLFAEEHSSLMEMCVGVDVIVHLAWYAEPQKYLWSPMNLNCLLGSLKLAKAGLDSSLSRFVGIGSCFEYDLNKNVFSINAPLRPATPYADAKAALFLALSHLLPHRNIEFSWCRLFYLYGANEHPDRLVPYLHSKLGKGEPAKLTIGDQIRDYLEVEEAGKMIAEIALSSKLGPVNICSGRPTTVRQLAEKIADLYGRRDLLHFGAKQASETDPKCVVGIR
jgi:nucleoside-diphosphate-sugar epimerase